jgi:hypothetical protein
LVVVVPTSDGLPKKVDSGPSEHMQRARLQGFEPAESPSILPAGVTRRREPILSWVFIPPGSSPSLP